MGQKFTKVHETFYPPLIPLITGGKVPLPPAEEGPGVRYFRINTIGKWCVRWYDQVGSTNDIARDLSPWHAVRADSQTSGRGRHGRSWISDRGGLWLSMAVPVEGARHQWKTLPLAAGWAILNVVKNLGIREARLRWPNDLMVKGMKLAGLLVEQFREGVAVVGVGINVFNSPKLLIHELTQATTRLSDHISPAPSLDELTCMILKSIKNIHQYMEKFGFSAMLDEINAAWNMLQQVELTLDREIRRGVFLGITGEGDLIVKNDSGHTYSYSPLRVKRFREVYHE